MRRAFLVALSAALLAIGCDTGTTEPNRTLALSGTLERSATAASTVSMRHTGNLRATAVELRQVAADGTTAPAAGIVTFTIGEDTGTTCGGTGNFSLLQGSVVSLGLERGDYCIQLTEPTVVPTGSTLAYNVRIEITD